MDSLVKILESKWYWFPFGKYVINKENGKVNIKRGIYASFWYALTGFVFAFVMIWLIFIPVLPSLVGLELYFWSINFLVALSVGLIVLISYLLPLYLVYRIYKKTN